MAKIQSAVVFDVDGVLVDSYLAHFQSWVALAEECGCHKMTEDEFRATFGRTSRETITQLWPGDGLTDAEIARLDDRKEQIFRDMLRSDFRPISGAAELIDELKAAGFAIAAGSSGPPDNVFLVLDGLGRRDQFDAVVTGVDVHRGKPDPEVFLLCAQRLGMLPSSCMVIEDAVVGIEAANGAGMSSVALVAAGRDPSQFHRADLVIRELSELSPQRIRIWMSRRSQANSPGARS